MFRGKLKRKREAWGASRLDGWIQILERPWAQFTFASEQWREEIARQIKAQEIDVLIVGPLNKIGMTAAGTLAEVNAFMEYIKNVRSQLNRPLVVILVHHENKGGAVSGAWDDPCHQLAHRSESVAAPQVFFGANERDRDGLHRLGRRSPSAGRRPTVRPYVTAVPLQMCPVTRFAFTPLNLTGCGGTGPRCRRCERANSRSGHGGRNLRPAGVEVTEPRATHLHRV
jgi:hypothetical protein